jgi:hypothetical protein
MPPLELVEMTEDRLWRLVVQDHPEQATMDRQPAVVTVIDKAKLPEVIHEMTDSRPGGADHFCQAFLTDSGNQRFCSAFLAERSEQQERPRQTDIPARKASQSTGSVFFLSGIRTSLCLLHWSVKRNEVVLGSVLITGDRDLSKCRFNRFLD